jgi:hypothetical protein
MIVSPEKNNHLNATICLETPKPESIQISALNQNYEYEAKEEFSNDLRKLLLNVEKKAIDFDELNRPVKHKIV